MSVLGKSDMEEMNTPSDHLAVRELARVTVTKNMPNPTTKRNRPMKSNCQKKLMKPALKEVLPLACRAALM